MVKIGKVGIRQWRVGNQYKSLKIGALGIGVLVLAVSRILLSSSASGAVLVATIVGVLIFGTAFFISTRPSISRGLVQSILFLGIAGILIAGLISAVVGERDFHHKGPDHHDDSHAEVEH